MLGERTIEWKIILFIIVVILIIFIFSYTFYADYRNQQEKIEFCESKGGIYENAAFSPDVCFIGSEKFELYKSGGGWKLAK